MAGRVHSQNAVTDSTPLALSSDVPTMSVRYRGAIWCVVLVIESAPLSEDEDIKCNKCIFPL